MAGTFVDTSSILFALSNKIDIFKAVEAQLSSRPVVSEGVIKELSAKSRSMGRNRSYASLALNLIDRYNVRIEKGSGYVDNWILDNASHFDYVCTNDSKLRRRLRLAGVRVCAMSRDGRLR